MGDRLKEAGYINLSLHYLAQVIVSLNKRLNGEMVHVPYRNSMMTMVLRDSLGGNCKTKMIATMNPAPDEVCNMTQVYPLHRREPFDVQICQERGTNQE